MAPLGCHAAELGRREITKGLGRELDPSDFARTDRIGHASSTADFILSATGRQFQSLGCRWSLLHGVRASFKPLDELLETLILLLELACQRCPKQAKSS